MQQQAMPQRIQRKRSKGYNMQAQSPDGRPVVSVCRPGKWGNPFKVGKNQDVYIPPGVLGNVRSPAINETMDVTAEKAVELYEKYLCTNEGWHICLAAVHELKGKHLACFCAPGAPCHADVLLKKANRDCAPGCPAGGECELPAPGCGTACARIMRGMQAIQDNKQTGI